jgi:hypothetical protein
MMYEAPEFRHLGSLTLLTLGSGGSTLDGTCLNNQRGKGNDDTGPKNPNC